MVQQDSPLLNLPAEIRNHIWTLAVVEADVIIASKRNNWYISPLVTLRLRIITYTSQQSRYEALPIYLDQNTFQLDRTGAWTEGNKSRLLSGADVPHNVVEAHGENVF